MVKLQDTWLIQRLLEPRDLRFPPNDPNGVRVHHVFGGGMLGLSKDAWRVIDPVFEPDYMGASEYEFGTLPNALRALVQSELACFELTVPQRGRVQQGPITLYVICRKVVTQEVAQRVREIAAGRWASKNGSGIEVLFRERNAEDARLVGWFELSNEFLFFRSQGMFERACAMFGEVPSAAEKKKRRGKADRSAEPATPKVPRSRARAAGRKTRAGETPRSG